MSKTVEKVYERVIVTPYKQDGYDSLNRAIEKLAGDIAGVEVGYDEQYVVRLVVEKLED